MLELLVGENMRSLKYLTRGNVNPQGKQKIYFSCYEEDICFLEGISNDILSLHDVAFYYSEKDDLDIENLKLMQLIVFPITSNFLYKENYSRLYVLKYALENKIPVLPLIQEDGLELEFNKICGDIQCLNKIRKDPTQISYNKKLQDFLNSILIDENMQKEINNAFDGSIFLSYRKKDREVAQKIIRKIHETKELQSHAIWYDEYLVPGEDYSDNIEEEIKKCSIFVMVVTPSLLENDNYVLKVEYPLAKKLNKKIVPLQAIDTSYSKLAELFVNIPNYYDFDNNLDEIIEECQKNKKETNINIDEKNYLLGLSYIYGINVEKNVERGISYLEIAKENKHIKAMHKLASIYYDGLLVKGDKNKAIELMKMAAPLTRINYSKERTLESFIIMIDTFKIWGEYLFGDKKYELSKVPYFILKTECFVAKKRFENNQITNALIASLVALGDADFALQKYEDAKKNHEEAYDLLLKNNELSDIYFEVVNLCSKLSNDCFELGDMKYMRIYIEAKVSVLELFNKENNNFDTKKYYFQSLYELAEVFYKEGDYQKAIELLNKSIYGIKELYKNSHLNDYEIQSFFDTAYAYLLLGKINMYKGKYGDAKELLSYLYMGFNTLFINNLDKCIDILADINYQLGHIFQQERKTEEAIKKYLESLIIEDLYLSRKTLSDVNTLIHTYQSICQCYIDLDDFENADKYLNKFMPLVNQYCKDNTLNSLQNIYVSSTLVATLSEHKKEYKMAEKALINAMDVCKQMNQKSTSIVRFIDLLKSYLNLGYFYVRIDKKENSFYFFELVYNMSKHLVEKTSDLEILHMISESCKNLIYAYMNDKDKFIDTIKVGIRATERYLEYVNDKEKELSLADLYILEATYNKGDLNLDLLEKSKQIYLSYYEEKKDGKLLIRIDALNKILGLSKEE